MDESRRESIGDGNVRNGELIEWFKSHDNSNNVSTKVQPTYIATYPPEYYHFIHTL